MSTIKGDSREFTFPRSGSPTKDKPNAHPYAIKTTSTALLSRSSSISNSSTHHYVPQTPPASPGPRKHSSGHRHRYSISLSAENLPRPLPVPPSPTKEFVTRESPLTLEDLPPNPKLWTPSQLCSYLSTALRVKSGESLQLPPQVARDIANFVRESRITGKVFLKLEDNDLETYGVNKLWKSALLRASQNLRQNVLKGQVWGFFDELESTTNSMNFPFIDEALPQDDGVDDDSTPNRRRRSMSQPQSRSRFTGSSISPFPNGLPVYSSPSSSSSTEDLLSPMISFSPNHLPGLTSLHSQPRRGHGRSHNGRVKGMVDSFERSSSFDEGDPTSAKMLQEIKDKRQFDLEQLRKLRRERSGSTSSGSFGSSHSPTSSDDGGEPNAFEVIASPVEDYDASTITASRPLPTPPESGSDLSARFPGEEEPSIEDLLAKGDVSEDAISNHPSLAKLNSTQQGKNGSFARNTFSISKGKGKARKRGGVYAWEEEADDFGAAAPGKTTAKRVPSQVPASMASSLSSAKDIFGDAEATRVILGETREALELITPNVGSGSGTHTPSRPLPEIPIHPSLVSLPETDDFIFDDGPTAAEPEETEEEKMLRASIAETTQLLQTFNARLTEVEQKVGVLEVEIKELETANVAREGQQPDEVKTEEQEKATTGEAARESTKDDSFSEWPIIRKVWNGLFRFTPSTSNRPRIFDHKYWQSSPNLDPQTLSQLPPYILLVGLGVCAVVLRVVAKKLSGKR